MAMVKEKTVEQCQIAIYSRKSKYTGKGESIENQIELCKQYIRMHYPRCDDGHVLVYEDEGFSGGNTDRPKFKVMMSDAKTKKFTAIVCYRLDRISRNIGDFAKLIEELDALKIDFISIKEQFDTSSPMGRAMMYISSVFSQLERETIAERIRDNMHELSKTGRWLGGTSPTGYVSESVENFTVDGKTKKSCKLKLVKEEAETVKQIYATFLATNSLTKTETYFIQHGYKTKNRRLFSRFALKNILTNPVYMVADENAYHYLIENKVDLFTPKEEFDGKHGIMAYNRTLQKPGKSNQTRPMYEWIVAVGKHTGIISSAAWIQAQALLMQNHSKSFRKPRSNAAMLSGLLFCGGCGDYMRPKLSKHTNAQGELRYTYLCAMKEKSRSHVCQMKNVDGNVLDKAFFEKIKQLEEDPTEFLRQLEMKKKQLANNDEGLSENVAHLEGTLATHEKEIAALVSSLTKASGSSAEEYIVKQIDELHSKNAWIRQRLEELGNQHTNNVLSDRDVDIIKQKLTSHPYCFEDMGMEQKRAALRTLVKKVVWDGADAHIYLYGAEET